MKSIAKIFLLTLLFTTSLMAQDDEFGIASYYSDLFHGKPTASGELYDKGKLTAAHKTLPFGTVVTVTRLDNNKSVQVTVNDRGPFISGRVVELSRTAAEAIGLINDGSARVKVTVSKPTSPATEAVAKKDEPKPEAMEKEVEPAKKEVAKAETAKPAKETAKTEAPKVNTKPAAATTTAKSAEPKKGVKAAAPSTSVLVKSQDYAEYDLYEVTLKRPEKKGFGVQVASLNSQDALFRKIADLQGDWFSNILVSVEKGKDGPVYKVILGPFATDDEAQVYKKNLKKKKVDGFVVDLSAVTKP